MNKILLEKAKDIQEARQKLTTTENNLKVFYLFRTVRQNLLKNNNNCPLL